MPLIEILRLREQNNASKNADREPGPEATVSADPPRPRRRGRPLGSATEREQLAAYLTDFARELGDEAPLSSTITRVHSLFQAVHLPPEQWGEHLYQARAITQERTAQIRTLATDGGHAFRRKNKMPYFLAVLADLIDSGANRQAPTAPGGTDGHRPDGPAGGSRRNGRIDNARRLRSPERGAAAVIDGARQPSAGLRMAGDVITR